MALFLKDNEITTALSMDQMLDTIEKMQQNFGEGKAYNLARRKIIASGGLLAVMGGGLFYEGIIGVKTYTVVKGQYSFQVSLYDSDSGKLLCYCQANRLGQLRTGATTGIALKYIGKNTDKKVGIIGTGYQSPTQLDAVCKTLNVTEVNVFSRTETQRTIFANEMSASLGIPVKPAATCEELVKNNDIIICIAATMTPVIEGLWVQRGTTIVAAGPTTWRAKEVDEETLRISDKLIVDSIEQAPFESGDLANAADQGIIQWSQLQELRYIVSGKYSGRDDNDQIIYAKLMGTGVADVAAAKLAYDQAKLLGLGTEMEW